MGRLNGFVVAHLPSRPSLPVPTNKTWPNAFNPGCRLPTPSLCWIISSRGFLSTRCTISYKFFYSFFPFFFFLHSTFSHPCTAAIIPQHLVLSILLFPPFPNTSVLAMIKLESLLICFQTTKKKVFFSSDVNQVPHSFFSIAATLFAALRMQREAVRAASFLECHFAKCILVWCKFFEITWSLAWSRSAVNSLHMTLRFSLVWVFFLSVVCVFY